MFWFARHTLRVDIEPTQIKLVYKTSDKEHTTEIIPKSDILSLKSEAIKRPYGSMAHFYLHLASTNRKTHILVMNSFKQFESFVSEWNALGYPTSTIKTLEEYKKEWKHASLQFIVIYFGCLSLLGIAVYLMIKDKL